ncbi:hypothetical protein [uncultured Microbacterium sp.]|uniref:hypothetical protein n=1 Tax=uncultured Microbacterium sp. TaxID=191216 RepID=UPI0028F0127F|nr:hypothetical protein [uncultured Microbacterium sp.]
MTSARSLLRSAALPLFGTALALTALSQLPGHSFDRIRRQDLFGLIPNWKFFAPIPATDDYEVFHRIRSDGDDWQDWTRTSPPAPRRLVHLVWFPGRRADKGIFDHASELAQLAITASAAELVLSPSYLVVTAAVQRRILSLDGVAAHQFAVIKHAGADESIAPEVILLSPEFGPSSTTNESPTRTRRPDITVVPSKEQQP